MSDSLTPEQHDLLGRIAAGDLTSNSAAAQAAAKDPAFAEALMNLEHTIARLDQAGRTERAVMRQAATTAPALRPDLVQDTLRRLAGVSSPRRARIWPVALGLLAAAAAVVLWLALRSTDPGTPTDRDRQQLGASLQVTLGGLHGDTLRWTCVPPAARYVVTVFDANAPEQPILDSQDLTSALRQPEWALDAEQRAKVAGRQLHWRVEAFRPDRRDAQGSAQGPLQVR